MKQFLILFSAFLFIVSCSSESSKTEVGTGEISFNQGEFTQTDDGIMTKEILVSAAQFSPCKEVWIRGSKFDLVIQKGDTIYLSTSDHLFRIPEKLHVESTFAEIPRNLRKNLSREPGWGYYIELPSGWNLGFCEGTSCTDSEPTDSSKVKWIFKRH